MILSLLWLQKVQKFDSMMLYNLEKAKPIVRLGRKTTGLIGTKNTDSDIAGLHLITNLTFCSLGLSITS
jgi:hypothetical protein